MSGMSTLIQSPALLSLCTVYCLYIQEHFSRNNSGKWANSKATVTIIVGGDGRDLIVLPLETISRVGFAKCPEANTTIKLHVE